MASARRRGPRSRRSCSSPGSPPRCRAPTGTCACSTACSWESPPWAACCSARGCNNACTCGPYRCCSRRCWWSRRSSSCSNDRAMIWLVLIGIAAGMLGGLLGVGGGVLFVPGLVVVVGLTQHEAEATSLLAIVPVAAVGALSQNRYGNVHGGDAVLMGLLSIAGVAGGVVLANALSGEALRLAFAALILLVAAQLVRGALRGEQRDPAMEPLGTDGSSEK